MLGLESNLLISIILFIVGSVGFFAYPPQIAQLYRTKKSDDINVLTYLMWMFCYLVLAAYTFIFTTSPVLFIINIIEGALCLWVIVLTLKYKKKV